MAKKRRSKARSTSVPRSLTGSKRKKKKSGGRKPKTAAQKAARSAAITKRVKLHSAAALLKDFHGGKLPVKSGCGRPRGS